LKVS